MSYYTDLCINLISAGLPILAGWIRFKSLDKAAKIFLLSCALTLTTEFSAFLAAKYYRNNLPVYNIANVVTMFVVAVYFNYCIDLFRKRNIGFFIGWISIGFGIFNLTFLESINQYNGNFFLYQTVMICIMGTFYFRQIMLPSYNTSYFTPHLLFTLVLVSFYILNFFWLSLYGYFSDNTHNKTELIDDFVFGCAIISNIGFAFVFFFYPKTKRSNAG